MSANQKRVIRKKAINFRIFNGEMMFKKKRRGKEEVYVLHYIMMVKACHADPTSGHLGFRKTLARITERFTWKGVSKDAKEIVSVYIT